MTADGVFFWANWIGVAALAVGVVCACAIAISGRIRDDRLSNILGTQKVQTAQANARAEEAKLELAKYKSPRVLTPAQQDDIGKRILSFAGTPYDIGIGPMGDPEPLYLARYIHSALSLGYWKAVDWPSSEMTYSEDDMPRIGLTMVTNVIVDVNPKYWKELRPAAEALTIALEKNGIDAIADSKPTSRDGELIHVRVGRRM